MGGLINALRRLRRWVSLRSTHPTKKHTSAFPRRVSPRLCQPFRPKEEGAGNAGCWLAPAVSCARDGVRCAHEHTGTAGALRHSSRNGFAAYAELSPETNSFCLPSRIVLQDIRLPMPPSIGSTRQWRSRFHLVWCSNPMKHPQTDLQKKFRGENPVRSAQLHFPTRQTVLVLQN
jgi:hypothetical protein